MFKTAFKIFWLSLAVFFLASTIIEWAANGVYNVHPFAVGMLALGFPSSYLVAVTLLAFLMLLHNLQVPIPDNHVTQFYIEAPFSLGL